MAGILVTRPEQDAAATAARLMDLGHAAIVTPLMDIRFVAGPALDLTGIQALLVTSANGARALAARQAGSDIALPVLAVGDATARAARNLGFTDVESAGGDVDDLARLAADRLRPGDGALLHVAGSKVAGDLAGMLAKAGYTYRRSVLYDARPVAALPQAAQAAIADGAAAGVLLYSPRTAALFRDLALAAGLEGFVENLTAFCLSANVAARAGAGWRRVVVAVRPTEPSLIDAVADWAPE
ncbi:uroporphyrinogen-III synthase [Thalassospiraceae bacterium LMO-SO8]|nr:uroporphyrinogen-III synthase [Alphaproteobacteria bacterium LMO-S08]WND77730.1 uroporphyrinogen-III synthase [Thalassospiraceae bacterium LMO-SO8]